MIFTSERLYVREYDLQDEDIFYQINSDEELMRYIRPPKDRAQARAFLEENLEFYRQHPGLGRWAMLDQNTHEHTGTFSLLPLHHTSDIHIGYALIKSHWGKGYAAEIVKWGCVYAFEKLNLRTIVAVTYEDNLPSQKVLLKNGFEQDGLYEEDGKIFPLFRLTK